MPKVIVVGGGFAGVSAATALAEAGISVDLLESRGFLGGRVYSTAPTENFPAPVDNGPHLFMGCYEQTLNLFKRLGEEEPLRWIDPLRLSWLLPGGAKASLDCWALPAPFHLAGGLLFSDAFPFSEKVRLVTALLTFAKKPFRIPPNAGSVLKFMNITQQGPASRERFWGPLTRAVMNVPPEIASISGLGEVLHRVFFGKRSDSAIGLANRPLSEGLFPKVPGFLQERGGKVHFHEGVVSFDMEGPTPKVTTRSGLEFTGDALLWAVPPQSLSALWPKETWTFADHFADLGKSPIVSVHVILAQRILQGGFLGLSGAQFEWVFNRNENWGWKGEDLFHRGAAPLGSVPEPNLRGSTAFPKTSTMDRRHAESPEKDRNKSGKTSNKKIIEPTLERSIHPKNAQYLSFTASAAEDLSRQKDRELVELALRELLERLPSGEEVEVLHSKVTREMAATFVWNESSGPLRPACETPFSGLFLAGDWTDTGLPATIEGACLSGHRAAGSIARSLGA